jgi:hypothetical protein
MSLTAENRFPMFAKTPSDERHNSKSTKKPSKMEQAPNFKPGFIEIRHLEQLANLMQFRMNRFFPGHSMYRVGLLSQIESVKDCMSIEYSIARARSICVNAIQVCKQVQNDHYSTYDRNFYASKIALARYLMPIFEDYLTQVNYQIRHIHESSQNPNNQPQNQSK